MEGVSTDDIRATLSRVKVANNLAAGLVMLACLWRRRGEDGAWIADVLQVPRSTIIHVAGSPGCTEAAWMRGTAATMIRK